MSQVEEKPIGAMATDSTLALAQWWGKEARVWLRLGNEERAGHAAATAMHFARRLEVAEEARGAGL